MRTGGVTTGFLYSRFAYNAKGEYRVFVSCVATYVYAALTRQQQPHYANREARIANKSRGW